MTAFSNLTRKLPFPLAITVLCAGSALSGCTTGSADLATQLQAAAQAEVQPAVALPEQVASVPTVRPNQPGDAVVVTAKGDRLVATAQPLREAPAAVAVNAYASATVNPVEQALAEAMMHPRAVPQPVVMAVLSAQPPAALVPPQAAPAPAARSIPSNIDTVFAPEGRFGPTVVAARSPELDRLIGQYATHYGVPETLVRRVVKRESTFDPAARNGPYWGLMQIRHDTAKGMGYAGTASGLLDAETNLKYAVRYLRGAYLTAKGDHDQAVRFYARGYYYDAKRAGLLAVSGLGNDRRRMVAQPAVATAKIDTRPVLAGTVPQLPATLSSSRGLPGVAAEARSARDAIGVVTGAGGAQAGVASFR